MNVANNRIAAVSKRQLLAVRNIGELNLSKNRLRFFPELQVLQRVNLIIMNKNPSLGDIGHDIFPGLTSLDLMTLNEIGADTVPWDICLRGNLADPLELRLNKNPLFCDERLRWLKLAEDAGVTVTDAECAGPSFLDQTQWEAVEWTQLRGGTACVQLSRSC